MDAFQFRRLLAAPGPDDTIAVYAAGTMDLLGDLTDLAGAPLANPFTPAAAGGVAAWGFRPASLVRVDIWWEQGGIYLAQDATVGGRTVPFEPAGAVAEHEAGAVHFARTAYQLSLSDAVDITLPSGAPGKFMAWPEPLDAVGWEVTVRAEMQGNAYFPIGIDLNAAAFPFLPSFEYCNRIEMYPAAVTGVVVELIGRVLHIKLDAVTPPTHLAVFRAIATYLNRPYALVDLMGQGYDPATEYWNGGGVLGQAFYPDGAGAGYINGLDASDGIFTVPWRLCWNFNHLEGGAWADLTDPGVAGVFAPGNEGGYTVTIPDTGSFRPGDPFARQSQSESNVLDANLSIAKRDDGQGYYQTKVTFIDPDGNATEQWASGRPREFYGPTAGLVLSPGKLSQFNVYYPDTTYAPHNFPEPQITVFDVEMKRMNISTNFTTPSVTAEVMSPPDGGYFDARNVSTARDALNALANDLVPVVEHAQTEHAPADATAAGEAGDAHAATPHAPSNAEANHPAATSAQTQNRSDTTLRSWTAQRIDQLVGQWGLDVQSQFAGIMKGGYREALYYLVGYDVPTTVWLPLTLGSVLHLDTGYHLTLNMPANPGTLYDQSGNTASFVLIIKTWNNATIVWGAGGPPIKWLTADGAPPALAGNNRISMLTFIWDVVGNRWLGFMAGKES